MTRTPLSSHKTNGPLLLRGFGVVAVGMINFLMVQWAVDVHSIPLYIVGQIIGYACVFFLVYIGFRMLRNSIRGYDQEADRANPRFPPLLLALLLIVGCNPSASETRPGDSVQLLTATAQEVFGSRTELSMVTTLGSESSFHRISDLAVFDNGQIAVLDGGDATVKVYSAEGSLLRQFGRPGRGPGELYRPFALAVARDTILVLDQVAHLFSTDGVFLMSSEPGLRVGDVFSVTGTSEGWLAIVHSSTNSESNQLANHRDLMSLDLVAGTSTTLTRHDAPPTHLIGPARFGAERVFESMPEFGIGKDGTVVWTPGSTYTVSATHPSRAAVKLTVNIPGRPVTSRLVNRFREAEERRFANLPTNEESQLYADAMVRGRLRLGVPDTLPVIGPILVGPNGRFVLQRLDQASDPLDREGEASHWDLWDSQGTPLAGFTLPPRTRPRAFDGNRIWASVIAKEGYPFIAAFDLPETVVGR